MSQAPRMRFHTVNHPLHPGAVVRDEVVPIRIIACGELGVTWQPVSEFLAGNGSLRDPDQLQKWTDFFEWYQSTAEYQQKGWPWRKPANGNDKTLLLRDGDQQRWAFLKHQSTNCLTVEGIGKPKSNVCRRAASVHVMMKLRSNQKSSSYVK